MPLDQVAARYFFGDLPVISCVPIDYGALLDVDITLLLALLPLRLPSPLVACLARLSASTARWIRRQKAKHIEEAEAAAAAAAEAAQTGGRKKKKKQPKLSRAEQEQQALDAATEASLQEAREQARLLERSVAVLSQALCLGLAQSSPTCPGDIHKPSLTLFSHQVRAHPAAAVLASIPGPLRTALHEAIQEVLTEAIEAAAEAANLAPGPSVRCAPAWHDMPLKL
ncbi:hypothetical protein PAPYR_9336 [Paratrimastix pyriformis]|uniref:Uncharacterized protein n=1 Tax=Paratrimastix pyriformis TaxID=342808 RepID=A0ABQ8U8Q6_9EUKA|nr:hypothetical protein PAPYR_9336 [Paratrimastix pyriformis]